GARDLPAERLEVHSLERAAAEPVASLAEQRSRAGEVAVGQVLVADRDLDQALERLTLAALRLAPGRLEQLVDVEVVVLVPPRRRNPTDPPSARPEPLDRRQRGLERPQALDPRTGDQVVQRTLVLAEPRHHEAEGEGTSRGEIRDETEQRRTEQRRLVLAGDDPDADEHLADRLTRETVEHRRVRAREDEREEERQGLEGVGALTVDARHSGADDLQRKVHDEEHGEVDDRGERADPEARGAR